VVPGVNGVGPGVFGVLRGEGGDSLLLSNEVLTFSIRAFKGNVLSETARTYLQGTVGSSREFWVGGEEKPGG